LRIRIGVDLGGTKIETCPGCVWGRYVFTDGVRTPLVPLCMEIQVVCEVRLGCGHDTLVIWDPFVSGSRVCRAGLRATLGPNKLAPVAEKRVLLSSPRIV
jgi:hypothetical protein